MKWLKTATGIGVLLMIVGVCIFLAAAYALVFANKIVAHDPR
jgi:hypothetical protein